MKYIYNPNFWAKLTLFCLYEFIFLLLLLGSLYPDAEADTVLAIDHIFQNPIGHMVVNETVVVLAMAIFFPFLLPHLSKVRFGNAEIEFNQRMKSMEAQVQQIDTNVKEVEKQGAINAGRHEAALFTIATSLSNQIFAKPRVRHSSENAPECRPITIGQLDFTESWLITELCYQALSNYNKSGFKVVQAQAPAPGENTLMTFFRLLTGKIDCFIWYSGTGMMLADGNFNSIDVNNEEAVRKALNQVYQPLGLHWLPSIGFEDSELLVMLEEKADALAIETMEDLKGRAHQLTFGANREFFLRDWYFPELQRQGFSFQETTDEVNLNDRLAGLFTGEFDVGVCMETSPYFTDKRIRVIKPTEYFPRLPQYAMPVCQVELLDDPNVKHYFEQLPSIDIGAIKTLIAQSEQLTIDHSNHPAIKGIIATYLQKNRPQSVKPSAENDKINQAQPV